MKLPVHQRHLNYFVYYKRRRGRGWTRLNARGESSLAAVEAIGRADAAQNPGAYVYMIEAIVTTHGYSVFQAV